MGGSEDTLVGRINSMLFNPRRIFAGITAASFLALAGCATHTYQLTPESLKGMLRKAARQSQIMSFGEHHQRMLDDFFVISLLPMLKEEGYTHIAYEIPDEFQGVIDSYISGEIDYSELKKRTECGSELPLLKAAKHYGFRVVAYDIKLDREKQEEILGRINNLQIISPENADDVLKLLLLHEAVISNNRESACIENLKRFIFSSNPDARVVLYSGAVHVNENSITRFSLMGRRRDVRMLGTRLNKIVNNRNYSVSLAEIEDVITDCGDWYSVDLHITPYKQLHFLRKFSPGLYRELWSHAGRRKMLFAGQAGK